MADKITWQWLVRQGLDFVSELADLDEPGPKKLERLKRWIEGTLEQVDDLAVFLPGGWGLMAKSFLDSDLGNQLQREWIYWPLAESIYQQWVRLREALGDNK